MHRRDKRFNDMMKTDPNDTAANTMFGNDPTTDLNLFISILPG